MQSHLIIAVLVIGLSGCAGLNVHYNEPVSANTGPGVSVFFDAFGDIYPEDVTLVFANHPNPEFHSSGFGWMNDSRFNGTAGSQ